MKAALYIRVSTDEQAQHGTSLKAQRDALEAHCKQYGMEVTQVYEDDGWSGSTIERPAFKRMMEDAEQRAFDIVLVHRLDRFSRSLGDAPHLIIRFLGSRDIAFKSITENFDSSLPQGKMLLGMLSGFADFERERIKDRSKEGKRRLAAMGKWVTSFCPLGYRKDEQKRLVIDKSESALYKRIVQWALKGVSTMMIARKLNALGVPTKHTLFSKKGKKFIWKAGTIYTILKKEFYYTGKIKLCGSMVPIPPLISQSQWERVQAQLTSNFNQANRNTKRFYLLRGLLECKKCGRNLHGWIKENRRQHVYCCISKRADPSPRWCGLKNIDIYKLDAGVWEQVRDLVKNSAKLTAAIERTKMTNKKDIVTLEAQQKWLEKQVTAKDSEIDRILGLYGKTTSLSMDELNRHVDQLKEDRLLIVTDLTRIKKSVQAVSNAEDASRSVEIWAKAIAEKVDKLNLEKRREFLQIFVQKIYVDWDEASKSHFFEIEGAVPIDGETGSATPSNSFKISSVILKQSDR